VLTLKDKAGDKACVLTLYYYVLILNRLEFTLLKLCSH